MASTDQLTPAQQHMLRSIRAKLEREFAGTFGPETIGRFLTDSLDRLLPQAKITTFTPIFAERFARDRLTALGKIEGTSTTTTPSVLFLCTHNAGRSQMAAGWLQHLAGDRIKVYSGGSEPASAVNPAAIAAMAEAGIDIANEYPKPWTDEIVQVADVVVTMGCGDACPIFPGKRYEDWELDDPAGLGVDAVRPIRDEIRRRVETLISELCITTGRLARHSLVGDEADLLAPGQLRRLTDAEARLHDTYDPFIAERDISAIIDDTIDRLRQPRPDADAVAQVESWAAERLEGLARSRHTMTSSVPVVVFVCSWNEARSQMAAGWLRHLGDGQIAGYSAGIRPARRLNPDIVAVMTEAGVDLTSSFPKPLTPEVHAGADLIVTLGSGSRRLRASRVVQREHWAIDDPAGKPLDTVRLIRDDIRTRVELLLATVTQP